MSSRALVRFCSFAALALTLGACSRADEQGNVIVVPGDVNHTALHDLERVRGRHLTREELLELHRVWLDNEVLYREGMNLPLDASEAANREKVISKALAAIDTRVRSAAVTDEQLRRWFEGRREHYEQPARFDFEDVALPAQSSEAAAAALVDSLNTGGAAESRASVRAFRARPESNLVQSYGPDVASALAKAPPGRWLKLRARDGWRAMRLVSFTPMSHAVFEAQREAIHKDWIEANVVVKRDAAVRELWKKYQIDFAESIECLADKQP